jgi:hypothetical protein
MSLEYALKSQFSKIFKCVGNKEGVGDTNYQIGTPKVWIDISNN